MWAASPERGKGGWVVMAVGENCVVGCLGDEQLGQRGRLGKHIGLGYDRLRDL